MQCERIRTQLTAYLDGELDGDDGTVVRGHLRGCDACRAIAADEAALRDGLRSLPPVDPPASLWAGVQARLAAEEVAVAERPAWKRTLGRWWVNWMPAPKLALAGALLAAIAIAAVYWKTRSSADESVVKNDMIEMPSPKIAPDVPKPAPKRTHKACVDVPESDDVTADLANDSTRAASAYDCAIEELLVDTQAIRADWNDAQRAKFDERVKSMRDEIAKAADGKPRKRANKALVAYIQNATIREDIMLAGVP